MSKPMSEQMQKVAARYEKATGKKFGQMTNAQRIRSMTDEELAKLLLQFASNVNSFRGRVIDWLKQPYSGGDA